jgi:hypothetical protein
MKESHRLMLKEKALMITAEAKAAKSHKAMESDVKIMHTITKMRKQMVIKHAMWHAKMVAAGIKWKHAEVKMNLALTSSKKYNGLYTKMNS